jgi:hypothetical protein
MIPNAEAIAKNGRIVPVSRSRVNPENTPSFSVPTSIETTSNTILMDINAMAIIKMSLFIFLLFVCV